MRAEKNGECGGGGRPKQVRESVRPGDEWRSTNFSVCGRGGALVAGGALSCMDIFRPRVRLFRPPPQRSPSHLLSAWKNQPPDPAAAEEEVVAAKR